VVFASSNHAVGMYEVEGAPDIYDLDDDRVYGPGVEVRPDSLYGVSKVFGEALGRLYADTHGLAVVCLRLGSVRETRLDGTGRDDTEPVLRPQVERGERVERLRATWLSHRDCAQLIDRALDSEVRWAVAYGISDNPRTIWDLTTARATLGYEPQDRSPVDP
jgi:NAD+ dependent glucose-6-phosphate dehydrogenase